MRDLLPPAARISPLLLAAVVAVACRRDCEPRIRGGSEAAQADVSHSVGLFLDALDPSLQVCVPRVTIDPEMVSPSGSYSPRSRRVEVVGQGVLGNIIYHEYCHAIHRQNNLSTGKIFEPLGQPEGSGVHDDPQGEGFAVACSFAMTISHLLGDECPGDGDDGAYRQTGAYFDRVDERFIELDHTVAFEEVARAEEARLQGPFTVEVFDQGVVLTFAEGATDLSLPHPGLPVDGVRRDEGGTIASTGSAELARFSFEYDLFRRVWVQEGRFFPLGCWMPHEQVFAFQDQLWSAYFDGSEIVVGRWTTS